MNSLTSTEIGEADSFIIHLIRPEGKEAYVASLELVLPDMRNRYSFKDGRSIEATFVDSVVVEIHNALSSVRVSDRLVSLPDLEIALPNLVLSGLRILVTRAEDGVEYLMLRFRRFVGALKSVFRFDTSMALPTPIMRERIAVEVLHDIVTPLFDIMSLNAQGLDHLMENHTSLLRKRINTIANRQEEITFYISMLQRYVAGCKSDLDQPQRLARQDEAPSAAADPTV